MRESGRFPRKETRDLSDVLERVSPCFLQFIIVS